MRNLKTVGTVMLWVLQTLVSLGFIGTGIGKFHGAFWIAAFARWGYPDSFRLLIGVLEVAGGLLLAFPRTASYAAALIGCIMVGAAGTLVLHKERAFAPIVWFACTVFIGIVRRRRAWRPISRRVPAALDPV
jgi:putative oxidoreductase